MSKFLGKFSTKLLLAAERFYLKAHGWIEVGPDTWDSPIDYKFRKRIGIRQGHAINSQKQNLFEDLGARDEGITTGRMSYNKPNEANTPKTDN